MTVGITSLQRAQADYLAFWAFGREMLLGPDIQLQSATSLTAK
jgi:hypothetical protein